MEQPWDPSKIQRSAVNNVLKEETPPPQEHKPLESHRNHRQGSDTYTSCEQGHFSLFYPTWAMVVFSHSVVSDSLSWTPWSVARQASPIHGTL